MIVKNFRMTVLVIDGSFGSSVDCTLSSESTGQDCLTTVCQKIGINQPEFFGLQYEVKTKGSDKNANENDNSPKEYRWVDLDLPLSRQLEKYAASNKVLLLRIMYYVVLGVHLITDEVTRNYYFLQLKSDVVAGKLTCDVEKAIILSNIALQAEYGNHQEHHTVEYLKRLISFPEDLITSNETIEEFTALVIQRRKDLHNVSQKTAEELYITECQELDGYGQEAFSAKNKRGEEVIVSIAVSGIFISPSQKFFPWYNISNVINHKRAFNIECNVETDSEEFNFPDGITGPYVWRLCVAQHKFFEKYIQNATFPTASTNGNNQLFQNVEITASRDDLDQSNWNVSDVSGYTSSHLTAATNIWTTPEPPLYANSSVQSRNSLQASTVNVSHIDYANGNVVGSNWGINPVGSNASLINRTQSSSCLDLSNNNLGPERDRLKAMLPRYRPAPDYETAVQQRIRANSQEINLIQHQQQPPQLPSHLHLSAQMLTAGSQPDMHRFTDAAYITQQPYPDVTRHEPQPATLLGPNYSDASEYGLTQRFKMMRLVAAPPPYPVNRLSSTSTPDLHRALLGIRSGYNVSGSSPDLVSSRTFMAANMLPGQHLVYPQHIRRSQNILPHGTYENLNTMHKIYEQDNVQLFHYPQPTTVEKILIHPAAEPRQHPKPSLSGSIEPIYENIPLPWPPPTAEQMKPKPVPTMRKEIQQQPANNVVPAAHMNKFKHQVLGKTASNPIVPPQVEFQTPKLTLSTTNSIAETTTSSAPSEITEFRQSLSATNHHNNNNNSQFIINRSHSTNILDSSQGSSNYTVETNTTDSGISSDGKKKRSIWNLLSRNRNNNEKQKSATLGREKHKKKKEATLLTRDTDGNIKHRWSTGASKLQALPTTIDKEKLCQLLETKLADTELFYEYEGIPKRKENARYDCALQQENKSKNIDPNFLPYDDNRVRLTPTRENRLGYVNASHITCTVGPKQRFYIVAQSPKDTATSSIFWQAVWEADVYLILQLTEEFRYVPPNSERCLEYGQYQVWREFSQESDRCVTSKLRIYHTQSRRYRSVWHLLYSKWGDQSCPSDVGHFLGFIEELSSVKLASTGEIPPGHNTNPPVMMHCGDGSSRSGITLAADLLLYIVDNNQDLDIPRVVSQLRSQRDNIIPSLANYKFIYSLLIHYLKHTRLI